MNFYFRLFIQLLPPGYTCALYPCKEFNRKQYADAINADMSLACIDPKPKYLSFDVTIPVAWLEIGGW